MRTVQNTGGWRGLITALGVILLLSLPATASDDILSSVINKLGGITPSANNWPGGRSLEWVEGFYCCLPALQGENAVYEDSRARQYADEILRMTNEARAKKGHPPLKRSRHLDAVSQAHALHMSERGFFEHKDPLGLEAWDRMEAADCPDFWLSGENIAAGYRTPEQAHKSWMDSAGHRKNIRKDEYEYIGIGVYYDENSDYGWYWVQTFASFRGGDPERHDWIEPGETRP